jgi:hypothetical protein
MSKFYILFIALFSSAFASDLTNIPQISDAPALTKPNKAHFLVKLGCASLMAPNTEYIPQVSFGYQTKINESSFFQSILLESSFGVSIPLDTDNFCMIISRKLSVIHYLHPSAKRRFFIGIGALDTFLFSDEHQAGYLGSTINCGIEIGKPRGIINIFKIEYDQPIIRYNVKNSLTRNGAISISYSLGF